MPTTRTPTTVIPTVNQNLLQTATTTQTNPQPQIASSNAMPAFLQGTTMYDCNININVQMNATSPSSPVPAKKYRRIAMITSDSDED